MTTATVHRSMTDEEFQAEFLSRASMPDGKNNVFAVVRDYLSTRQRTMDAATELGIGVQGTKEIATKSAKAFLKRWMMLKFATVDLSFTERKWLLRVSRNQNSDVTIEEAYNPPDDVSQSLIVSADQSTTVLCEVNRFFKVEQELDSFAINGLKDKSTTQKDVGWFQPSRKKNASMSGAHINITASVPDGIGPKQINVARKAMGHYYLAQALLYERGIDLEAEIDGKDRRWNQDDDSKILVIWGPNLNMLVAQAVPPPRPKIDPAIVLELFGENYLLDFYDTPDETPITNLIREFSEGKIA